MLANSIKKIAKQLLAALPFAISKNDAYDRYTKLIIKNYCQPDSVCIDIGANEGKILEWIIKYCPLAKHFAFEPIPSLFLALQNKFALHAWIYPIALSDQKAETNFNFVFRNPALSGFQKRPFDKKLKEKQIEVQTDLLDHFIDPNLKITLLKIDVEGGEMLVLKGAVNTINNSKPLILFESGKIGADMYGFTSSTVFQFFKQEVQYNIYLLKDWLALQQPLSDTQFDQFFENGKEYFFLAAPIDIAIEIG